jgi:uncharacterized protein (UPF0332 family)
MKPDVEKHLRLAEEIFREMELLMAQGLYKSVVKRTYHAMLNAVTAALFAKEFKSGSRQAVVSEFNEAFVKTGVLDEKFYRYFSQAFRSQTEPEDTSFASVDHRQAQTSLLRAKELIEACRVLCD